MFAIWQYLVTRSSRKFMDDYNHKTFSLSATHLSFRNGAEWNEKSLNVTKQTKRLYL